MEGLTDSLEVLRGDDGTTVQLLEVLRGDDGTTVQLSRHLGAEAA